MSRLVSFLAALLLTMPAWSQTLSIKPTPPGEVLRTACSKVNAGGSSARDMMDRGYCLRFIEGALMYDRALFVADQRRISEAIRAGNADPLALFPGPRLFCIQYSDHGVHSLLVADVAAGLTEHLRRLAPSALDRQGNGDDVQMRLLVDYMKSKYPCTP